MSKRHGDIQVEDFIVGFSFWPPAVGCFFSDTFLSRNMVGNQKQCLIGSSYADMAFITRRLPMLVSSRHTT